MAKYEFDASPYLDFIASETAYQVLHGSDPDLSDHRSGDFFLELDEDDDWS